MPELTATTVRYLFAGKWAAPAESGASMRVPGAKVEALDTAANLLNIAVWSLREQGLVEVQQIRPVKTERIVTMGGHSFARVTALGQSTPLPGLEGALLAKIQEPAEAGLLGRFDDLLAQKLSGDDPDGLRGHILALNLSSGSPWGSVANYCRDEAVAAGIVALEGRFRKRPVIADETALAALEPRDQEIAAARKRFHEGEPELSEAVLHDAGHAVDWAHQTSD